VAPMADSAAAVPGLWPRWGAALLITATGAERRSAERLGGADAERGLCVKRGLRSV